MIYDKFFKMNRPDISISTIKSYSATIRGLMKKMGIVIETPKDIIKNVDKVIEAYTDVKYNSRKTHISALISFIDDNSDESRVAVNKLRKIMIEDIGLYNKFIDSQEKSDSQKSNWVEWDDVIKRYQSFEKEVIPLWKLLPEELSKNNFNKLKMFVLLSCYILIPPRRSLDYVGFKIREINITKDNYMKGRKFIFNTYKTSSTYGLTEVDISQKLYSIIKKWTVINQSDYLITGNNDKIKPISSPQLTNMLNSFFDKRVSVNILRHSFLTHLYKDLPDLKNIAKDMGHEVSTALEYVKK